MPKWEYKNLIYEQKKSFWKNKPKNEDKYIPELNRLGEDGWELVAILRDGETAECVYATFILKRQVNE